MGMSGVCVCLWVVCACVGVGDVCVCVEFGCMYVHHPPTQHNMHNSCAQQHIISSAANQIHLQILSTPTDCNHGNTQVGIRHIMNTGVTYECHTIIKFQKIDTFPNDYRIFGNFRGKKIIFFGELVKNKISVEKTFTDCCPTKDATPHMEKTFVSSQKTCEIQENSPLYGVPRPACFVLAEPRNFILQVTSTAKAWD